MISACIITKNEEKVIGRCLESLSKAGFDIVLADTGSTDSTKEIASLYTKQIYDFPWCNDFSKAKNFVVSKASSRFVMIIDSDEYIESGNAEKLYAECLRKPTMAGRILRTNQYENSQDKTENKEWINRVFDKSLYRYEGRIHEQIISVDSSKYYTFNTCICIGHTGYDLTKEELDRKTKRNIDLLNEELKALSDFENSTETDEKKAYNYYQLGKCYFLLKDYPTAEDYFIKATSYDLNPEEDYVKDLIESYGYTLLNLNKYETAMGFADFADSFKNDADFLFLMGLIYMNNACFDRAIESFKECTNLPFCKASGINSYLAFYNIGVIHECLGNTKDALYYYEKCGNYEPAHKRIKELNTDIKN